jgi:serine/threonine protein kinase
MTLLDVEKAPPKVRPIAELGRGGMAEVCLAVAQGPAGFHKLMVLKKVRPELADDPEFLTMFLDEARIAARLNHPNVVQTYEVGDAGGRYFIAMEYLDGQPLHRILARVGPQRFPLSMQIRIIIEALAGLHYAHELTDFDGAPLDIVHRDATPHNVFVTYEGQIKVVDFGIAKSAGALCQTALGVLKGKVPYMAPEQARGEPVDRRTDIFTIGVVLWEAITGDRMWKGMGDVPIIGNLSEGRIPALSSVQQSLDPWLSRICLRAIAPAPEDRYATAAALQHELERWLDRRAERVTARDVGSFVAAQFIEDRAAIKALIEQHLGASCRALPLPWPRPGDAAPTSRDLPTAVAGPRPLRRDAASSDTLRESGESLQKGVFSADVSGDDPETLRSSSISVDAVGELWPGTRSARRSRPPLAIGSAILIMGALVVGAWTFGADRAWVSGATIPVMLGLPAPAREEDSLRRPSAAPSPGGTPVAVGEVDLTVRVWPSTAQLFLDGAPLSLSRGAYRGKLPRDGQSHWIRAEARGFVAKEQPITAAFPATVALTLDREPVAPPRP